jgi:hypothetical protein
VEVTTALKLRTGQKAFMRLIDEQRLTAFLARRQYGKTTTFAAVALKKMMKRRDHTVIFGSAKLNLSREIVRKEAAILQVAIDLLAKQAGENTKGLVQIVDTAATVQPKRFTADDFAGAYEAQRLEFRYYHSRTSYSRTKVVALLPDTVGETGDLMMDEVGRVRNFREVWEAVEPIVQSNPEFRCTICTTPPPDDSHFSFEMLAHPIGTEFHPNPAGNRYRSDFGVQVLRVDAWDAAADGVPVYDLESGEPLTPEQSRQRAADKDAWDRNYGVKFVLGGAAACSLIQLDVAQKRGVGQCEFFQIENDADFLRALSWISANVGPGPVGIGVDLATTEKETSNPTGVAICERVGVDFVFRALLAWKVRDPDIATERLRAIAQAVARRKSGARAKAMAVDATSEKYFAAGLKRELGAELPVHLVVGSERVEKPGQEPMNWKQWLGSQLVGELDDNHVTLPPQRGVREDFRLVKKERGMFTCEPDPSGRHGDLFDGAKLALHAVLHSSEFHFARVEGATRALNASRLDRRAVVL